MAAPSKDWKEPGHGSYVYWNHFIATKGHNTDGEIFFKKLDPLVSPVGGVIPPTPEKKACKCCLALEHETKDCPLRK